MASLAERVVAHEVDTLRWYTESDRGLRRRYGLRVARVRGVSCFSHGPALRLGDFALQAIGFGVLSEPSPSVLEAIVRHYARLGLRARLLLAEGLVPAGTTRLLRRFGFAPSPHAPFVAQLLRTSRVPAVPTPRGVTLERVRRSRVDEFVRTARDGFEDRGLARAYFGGMQRRLLADHPRRAVGVLARVDGAPAGTGAVYFSQGLASLGSGAVLRRYRGRGIQTALIRERVALGLARGVGVFVCRTEESNRASAENLSEAGFRPYYRGTRWERESS